MRKNKGLCLLLIIVILVTSITIPTKTVSATSKNIKVDAFVKLLVNALELEVDKKSSKPYIDAAIQNGIVKDNDFSSYTGYITRTDVAVLLNRADEYLHGDTVDAKLLKIVLEKRISDIKKIAKGKRESVAKIVSKGIIKGYSNGQYIQNREFRGSEFITTSGAKNVINLIINPKYRAKISLDGQLIRTTNLPKNADKFEYILECFPNSFYENKFDYQLSKYYYKPVELKDYASPVRMKNRTSENMDIQNIYKIYKDEWIKKVELNLQTRLNVDYRTIDKDNTWLNNLRNTYFIYNDAESNKDKTNDIKDYIKKVKQNKIIIKSQIISVEPSTLYYSTGHYVRVYVKFKVTSGETSIKQKDLIYGDYINLYNLKKDTWFEGVYDIKIATRNGSSDGSDYAVSDDSLNDYFFKSE